MNIFRNLWHKAALVEAQKYAVDCKSISQAKQKYEKSPTTETKMIWKEAWVRLADELATQTAKDCKNMDVAKQNYEMSPD